MSRTHRAGESRPTGAGDGPAQVVGGIAVAAGLATLELLEEEGVYEKLSARTSALADGLAEIAAEVRDRLDDDEYRVFAPRFGLDRAANFEGRWHLHVYQETTQIADASGLALAAQAAAVRERHRPGDTAKISRIRRRGPVRRPTPAVRRRQGDLHDARDGAILSGAS